MNHPIETSYSHHVKTRESQSLASHAYKVTQFVTHEPHHSCINNQNIL